MDQDQDNEQSNNTNNSNTNKSNERRYNKGRWTTEEHEKFLSAMRIHGKDWDMIEEFVGTRDAAHCRSHA